MRMTHTPRLARCAWPLSPLQGAMPVARRSRFHGISGLKARLSTVTFLEKFV
jgi:hypothetical protein